MAKLRTSGDGTLARRSVLLFAAEECRERHGGDAPGRLRLRDRARDWSVDLGCDEVERPRDAAAARPCTADLEQATRSLDRQLDLDCHGQPLVGNCADRPE